MDQDFIQLEEERREQQLQQQIQIQRQRNKFVGLLNTGNLCYLNSTMQVIFSMPVLCEQIIQFFEQKDKKSINDTTLSFVSKLKEKKQINEGTVEKDTMDLSELRLAFNKDLLKRHRKDGNCFGMKQNDSSEFYIFLFEFLVKFGRDQDLHKNKNNFLNDSDNPPSQIERSICRRNYSFNTNQVREFEEYLFKESNGEQQQLEDQLKKLQMNLQGLMNPIEEYFFNGHILSYLGPCKYCNYESLSIHDFSMFELNFPERNSYFGYGSVAELKDMIFSYFKKTNVNSRCKNINCKKYPINILKNKSERTIYFDTQKSSFLVNTPKILKFLFKKYEWSPFGGGSRLNNNVNIPVKLNKEVLQQVYFQSGTVRSLDSQKDCLLKQIANNYNNYHYYLFSYSQQSGSLDSGHYITRTLQYYRDPKTNDIQWYDVVLNDSSVSNPIHGGGVNVIIQVDAYWVMYVREDQEDFNNQLQFNKPPINLLKKKNESWL